MNNVRNFTNEELETAYRIQKRNYLEEDFRIAIEGEDLDIDLEKFPEIMDVLCEWFEKYYDASISHNEQIKAALGHVIYADDPCFFNWLATSPVAENANRSRTWEICSAMVSEHERGTCTCGEGHKCDVQKYRSGEISLSKLFDIAFEA